MSTLKLVLAMWYVKFNSEEQYKSASVCVYILKSSLTIITHF